MKKLNNKGITTIEVIVCFVLVVIITTAMYSTISSFNERRMIEQYKEQIYTYKNLLTKEIQDDFIKIGLTHAQYEKKVEGNTTKHIVDCRLKDGTSRRLIITQRMGYSSFHLDGSDVDDYYMIEYGEPDDLIEYPIPDLGESKIKGKIIKDLSINNVIITINKSNILKIYIGFYHPELATRYGIRIVCPIDYVSTGTDATNSFIEP